MMFSLNFGFPEAAAWYESGNWPLLGAIATLIVSNLVSIGTIVYQQKSSRKHAVALKNIDYINAQLEGFYNPLQSLLMENQIAFRELGPATFSQHSIDDGDAEAAAKFWIEIRDNFIIPNNTRISEIIRMKSHLISGRDSLENYMRLKIHIDAYAAFQKSGSERYSGFTFPVGIEDHVTKHRNYLVNSLKELAGEA